MKKKKLKTERKTTVQLRFIKSVFQPILIQKDFKKSYPESPGDFSTSVWLKCISKVIPNSSAGLCSVMFCHTWPNGWWKFWLYWSILTNIIIILFKCIVPSLLSPITPLYSFKDDVLSSFLREVAQFPEVLIKCLCMFWARWEGF